MVVRRDYILRLIEELAQALARILNLRQTNQYAAALTECNDACKQLTGLPLKDLEQWPAGQIMNFMQLGGRADKQKCAALAQLLRAAGDIYGDMNDPRREHLSRCAQELEKLRTDK
jgi:hypothetical protein